MTYLVGSSVTRSSVSFIVSIAVLGILAAPSFAQTETVYLGGVDLRLGMPRAEVLAALKREYELREQEGGVVYLLKKRLDGSYQTSGLLQFEPDDTLIVVSKNWQKFESSDAVAAMTELFSALVTANQDGKRIGLASTQVLRAPGTLLQIIEFRFGEKRVSVYISEGSINGQRFRQVQIYEGLSRR